MADSKTINSCDHLIGFVSGEKVNISTLNYELNRITATQTSFKKYKLTDKEPLQPKDLVDNRRGYLYRFKFCPYCGIEINWKLIIKNIKND